jgi:hypothetical protein
VRALAAETTTSDKDERVVPASLGSSSFATHSATAHLIAQPHELANMTVDLLHSVDWQSVESALMAPQKYAAEVASQPLPMDSHVASPLCLKLVGNNGTKSIAVIGNGPLSDEDRKAIQRTDRIIRRVA